MTGVLSLFGKFYAYQKERFPVGILALSLLPAALSSGAVVSGHPRGVEIAAAVLASLIYLFHIRVLDEHRDFAHDNAHHQDRPIQQRIIARRELRVIDGVLLFLLSIIALASGLSAVALALCMIVYSYIAGKEFFIGERLRKRFFLYNGINVVQMLLMQLFVYAIFANPIPLSAVVATHFIFTTTGTILFELVRKIKVPGQDGTGEDMYTYYLGFGNAIAILLALLLGNSALFLAIALQLSTSFAALFAFTMLVLGMAAGVVLLHSILKQHKTDRLMQLAIAVAYGLFNIAIYYLVITR